MTPQRIVVQLNQAAVAQGVFCWHPNSRLSAAENLIHEFCQQQGITVHKHDGNTWSIVDTEGVIRYYSEGASAGFQWEAV